MRGKASATVTIERPIGEVFSYVTDVEKMPGWMSGVRAARLVSKEMGRGARYVLDYIQGWRPSELEIEVTEFEPPRSFASRIFRGPFAYEGRIELREVETATEVTNTIEAGPDSLSTRVVTWLLGPLLLRSFTRRLVVELEDLRRAIAA
ncbi:MAG: SRPBCC family protein [Acidimicrobiia bacterium]